MPTDGSGEIHVVRSHSDIMTEGRIIIKLFQGSYSKLFISLKRLKIKLLFKYKLSFLSENGTLLVTFAVILPAVMILAGMITDIGRAFAFRSELNKACMIAAEEASKEIDMISAQEFGRNSLDEKYAEVVAHFFYLNVSGRQNFSVSSLNFEVFGESSNPRYLKVSCEAEINCFFLKLIGIPAIAIHSSADGRLKRISKLADFYCTGAGGSDEVTSGVI
ncbi:MAG: hypothetical protein FJW66_00370 [Actinobacteria bacterium]|nr:hypothetical protein [Actinomycetota bacterium]